MLNKWGIHCISGKLGQVKCDEKREYDIKREKDFIITLNYRLVWLGSIFLCKSWNKVLFVLEIGMRRILLSNWPFENIGGCLCVRKGEFPLAPWFLRFTWEEKRGASWSRVEKHRRKVFSKITRRFQKNKNCFDWMWQTKKKKKKVELWNIIWPICFERLLCQVQMCAWQYLTVCEVFPEHAQ